MSDEPIALHPDRDLTDDDAPLRLVHTPGRCSHYTKRFRLDGDTKRAYCRDCDGEVPLWDVLAAIAGDFEMWVRIRREAERRAREAQTRLEETLRLERNARGRVVRADAALKAQLPRIPWGEGRA